MNKKIIILLIINILLLIFILYPEKSDEKNYPLFHITLISQNMTDSFWDDVKKGADAAADEFNIFIEYLAPKFSDAQEHKKFFDMEVNAGVDGIITYGYENLSDSINKTQIPVIAIKSDVLDSGRISFVGNINYEIGKKAANIIYESGKRNTAIIINSESENNLIVNGFLTEIKNYPDMNVLNIFVSKFGSISSEEIVQSILDKADAIFTTGFSDTIGAAQVITSSNLVGKIIVVGSGINTEIEKYINYGVIYASISSDPYKMGYESVKKLTEYLEGNSIPNFVPIETKIITLEDKEN
ncbi:MAG: substrate-binding domain-containing protein [Thermotogae bacterium]|nr:substrate-binding domain-containing protein [Thermotogota bacterium]MCP5465626.1 substrate-binding domain-containing protein [Thermotogota bacterium]